LGYQSHKNLQEQTAQATIENRAVACTTADLIAHVPDVQFEGEPLNNFLGWIEARHDILVAAKAAHVCEPDIIEKLERRIALDNELLRSLNANND
jgi:hypothetical protein